MPKKWTLIYIYYRVNFSGTSFGSALKGDHAVQNGDHSAQNGDHSVQIEIVMRRTEIVLRRMEIVLRRTDIVLHNQTCARKMDSNIYIYYRVKFSGTSFGSAQN